MTENCLYFGCILTYSLANLWWVLYTGTKDFQSDWPILKLLITYELHYIQEITVTAQPPEEGIASIVAESEDTQLFRPPAAIYIN